MKYSEFKTEVEKMGFTNNSQRPYGNVFILYKGNSVGSVSTKYEHVCNIEFESYYSLPVEKRKIVLELVSKLAITPLAEREEEKRYWLRNIPVPLLKESDDLWYYEPINKLFKPGVDRDRTDNEKYKSIFTESEISQMDITGFEKEPVK